MALPPRPLVPLQTGEIRQSMRDRRPLNSRRRGMRAVTQVEMPKGLTGSEKKREIT